MATDLATYALRLENARLRTELARTGCELARVVGVNRHLRRDLADLVDRLDRHTCAGEG